MSSFGAMKCLVCFDEGGPSMSFCENKTHKICRACLAGYLRTFLEDTYCRPIMCIGRHCDATANTNANAGNVVKRRMDYRKYKEYMTEEQKVQRLKQAKNALVLLCSCCHTQNTLLVDAALSHASDSLEAIATAHQTVLLPLLDKLQSGYMEVSVFYETMCGFVPDLDSDVSTTAGLLLSQVLGLIEDPELRCAVQLQHYQRRPVVQTVCCKREHCFKCKTKAHDGSCEENSRSIDNRIVFCPRCSIVLTKGDGCALVTCICGETFSWNKQVQVTQDALFFSRKYPTDTALCCANVLALHAKGRGHLQSVGSYGSPSRKDTRPVGRKLITLVAAKVGLEKSYGTQAKSSDNDGCGTASVGVSAVTDDDVEVHVHMDNGVGVYAETFVNNADHEVEVVVPSSTSAAPDEGTMVDEVREATAWRSLYRRESDAGLVRWWDKATRPFQAHEAARVLDEMWEEELLLQKNSGASSLAVMESSLGSSSVGRSKRTASDRVRNFVGIGGGQTSGARGNRNKSGQCYDIHHLAARLWTAKAKDQVSAALVQRDAVAGGCFSSMFASVDKTRVALRVLRGEIMANSVESGLKYRNLLHGADAFARSNAEAMRTEEYAERVRALQQFLLLYGASSVKAVLPTACYVPVMKPFDLDLSNAHLKFSPNKFSVLRPGSVSSYPGGFVGLPSSHSSFTILINDVPLTLNWLTIGISKGALAPAGSDGFGRSENTWGIRDDRSYPHDPQPFSSLLSNDVSHATWRKLRSGDVICVAADTQAGRLLMTLNNDEARHEFNDFAVGNPADFFFGVTLSTDTKVTIVPSPMSAKDVEWFRSTTVPEAATSHLSSSRGDTQEGAKDMACCSRDRVSSSGSAASSLSSLLPSHSSTSSPRTWSSGFTKTKRLNADHSNMYMKSVRLLRDLLASVMARVNEREHVLATAHDMTFDGLCASGVDTVEVDSDGFSQYTSITDGELLAVEEAPTVSVKPLPSLLHKTPAQLSQLWQHRVGGDVAAGDAWLESWALTLSGLGIDGAVELVERVRALRPKAVEADDCNGSEILEPDVGVSLSWMDVVAALYWIDGSIAFCTP